MPTTSSRRILRLRVTLVDSTPEIWRSLEVDQSMTLAQFDVVLMVAFDWQGPRVRRFMNEDPWVISNGFPRVGAEPRTWGDTTHDRGVAGMESVVGTTLGEAMHHGGPLWYLYDDEAEWVHCIEVLHIYDAGAGHPIAVLLDGERQVPRDRSEWDDTPITVWTVGRRDDPDLVGARGELATVFGHPATDSSGLVGVAGLTADSPLVRFAQVVNGQQLGSLRRHLWRCGLLEPEDPGADDDLANLVEPYRWLLDRVGVAGIALTKAGWMPPAVVLDGMTVLGPQNTAHRGPHREDRTRLIRVLRATAERLHLLRVVDGRLVMTPEAHRVRGSTAALANLIARRLLRQEMSDVTRESCLLVVLGLADTMVNTRRGAERYVLAVLDEVGFADVPCLPRQLREIPVLVAPVCEVFETMGLWRTASRPTPALRALARVALW